MPWAQLPRPTRALEPRCPSASSGARGWQVLHESHLGQPSGGGDTFLSRRLHCRCKLPTLIPGILRVKRKYSKHYYLILTIRENNFSEDYNCHRSLKSFRLPEWNLNWQSIFLLEGRRFPETCIAFSWFSLTTDRWSGSQKAAVSQDVKRPSVLARTVPTQARTCWFCGQLPSPTLSVNSFWRV